VQPGLSVQSRTLEDPLASESRNFDREYEALRRSSIPVFNRAGGRTRAERRVHLDGVKPFGVEREVVGRLHASRVEGAVPAGGRE
jgi:hypothetical protein